MGKLATVILYLLWSLSLIGLLVITFTNFQYEDLNAIVAILFVFTFINTFLAIKQKR